MKTTNETTDPLVTNDHITTTETQPTEAPAPPPQPDGSVHDPTAFDTLRTENENLRTALRLRDARDQVTAALTSAGARSPDLLFEASKEMLRFDADGRARGIETILKSLRSKYPEQFASETAAPPSIDAGSGTANDRPQLTKEALAKMSPTDIAKLDWTEIRRILTER